MKVRFCGVRGSTPAPGAGFVGTGGHTACVAVTPEDRRGPTLLLDAGTGIRTVTDQLGGAPFVGAVALTHLHWDHVQGLPFFAAGDRPDARVRLLLPAPPGRARDLLARAMSPPHFPIGPEGLLGEWSIEALPAQDRVGGLRLLTAPVPHKGGRTVGLRVEEGGRALAYLPDHALTRLDELTAPAAALVRGADLLVHDAQFTDDERDVARRYGHATVEAAVDLALACGVGELALFHHAPARDDREVEQVLGRARRRAGDLVVSVAREGGQRHLGGAGSHRSRPSHPGPPRPAPTR